MKKNFTKALGAFAIASSLAYNAQAQIVINEFDTDDSDDEFIELYNTTGTSIDLAAGGYALVFLNGSNNLIYQAEDLTGTIAANGYYTIVESASVRSADLVAAFTSFQNGEDGIALVSGASAAAFPNNGDYSDLLTSASAVQVDAIIYDDTATPLADPDLEAEFGLSSGKVIQSNTNGSTESVQRSPDGQGGANDSWVPDDWVIALETFGAANVTPPVGAVFGDVFTSTTTTISAEFDTPPVSGGEGTPGNWTLNDASGAVVTSVSGANPYLLTVDTALSGDAAIDTLTFDNGSDPSNTGDFYAGIADISAFKAVISGDANQNPTFAPGLVTVSSEVLEVTLDDNDTVTLDGIAIVDFSGRLDSPAGISGQGANIVYVGFPSLFNGLFQIDGNGTVGVLSDDGDTILDATPIALGDVTALTTATLELNESRLVTITNIEFTDAGTAILASSSNYSIVGVTDFDVRIDSDVDDAIRAAVLQGGRAAGDLPFGPGEITGIIGQFDGSDPRDSGYQIFPLLPGDFNYPLASSVDNWMLLEK